MCVIVFLYLCVSYEEEEDTCVSYEEEEDTCVSYEEEEDTCVSYEEEDTCGHRLLVSVCVYTDRHTNTHTDNTIKLMLLCDNTPVPTGVSFMCIQQTYMHACKHTCNNIVSVYIHAYIHTHIHEGASGGVTHPGSSSD
jgi:hypothetical protein